MLRYKACRNSIVTLKLLNDSVTNEKRDVVVNDKYAKFGCDRAKVVNITEVKTGARMVYDTSIYTCDFCYRMGKIVKSHFDGKLDIVCASGIHYFKTKEAALSWFYRQKNQNFPDGKWTKWYENGQKESEGTHKDWKHDGKWIGWHDNGKKYSEGVFKDGEKDGKWTWWFDNGLIGTQATFKNGRLVNTT